MNEEECSEASDTSSTENSSENSFYDDPQADLSDPEADLDDSELDLYGPRNQNLFEKALECSDAEFLEIFRLTRQTTNHICERYEKSWDFNYQVGPWVGVTAMHQVLIYLWVMGHQNASFRDAADGFGVTVLFVNRIIHRMAYFFSDLSPEIIKWPNRNEKRISESHFRTNGFPNVIGAIDVTHIKIDKPEKHPDSYLNGKGEYSVQIQAVCDHRRKIIDIFIGTPGSLHNSSVFSKSPLKNSLEAKCGKYYLLGDSGYPLLPNLLTPYKDRGNLTTRQQNYNLKLSKNHRVIEDCFDLLMQKFRQLHYVKLGKGLICDFLTAACVLHNIALDDNFVVDNEPMEVDGNNILTGDEHQNDDEDAEDMEARAVRDRVANTLPM